MANKNIPIIPLKESDIISQSVNTINQNFYTIRDNYDIANFKWEQYSKKITDEIEKLKRHCDKSNIDISRSVDSLNTRIDNITDLNDIQTQINNAIMNANLELTGFISDLAGQQVANAMGGYVKTSSLDNKLKGYVASSAFETYKSDAKNRTASSNLIVANSKFATVKYNGVDYLIKSDDGTKSSYKTIEEYWEKEAKSTYPDLSDAYTLNAFIGDCETKFKTVSTELANISAKVGQGSAQVGIIATVKNELGNKSSNDAKDITAAIFARANQYGSEIQLNADNLNLNADHKLTLKSGTFEINSSNFTLNDNGLTLSVNGGKTRIDANGTLHAQGADIQGTITADRFESEKTDNYTVSVGENDYSGAITKKTLMNSNEFCIESIGKFSPKNGIGSDIDVTGNKLYIKIMDKLPNANTDIKDADGKKVEYLYGVPVLCMMYNNVEYPLSPASWFMPSSGNNPTDMYFIGGSDNNTYTSVSSSIQGFYRPSQKNVRLTLSNCKKYVFAYSNPGNENSYKDILLKAGLINSSNVGVTTYNVEPEGLIKTTQSVGKIPIAEGEDLKKFKNNIKPSCDIYQRFTDSGKEYFGDFSSSPYSIDDVGNTKDHIEIITKPSWFNSNIFNYIKDNLNTGNWSYGEGIDSSQQSSEPDVYFNPFNNNIEGGICGNIRYNIVGYYKQSYTKGFPTNTSSVNGFADCEYVATIYFNKSENVFIWAMVDGVSKKFYATDMSVRVSFGVYNTISASELPASKLMNLLKSGTINNIDDNVHIEADINLSSQPGVIGYDGISLVYRNNS